MSIRPTYRKRSVVQVLADGMSAHPPKSETHINVTADADSTPADLSEKLRKLSEEFKEQVQVHALRDAEGNVVEHVLTPRKFAAGGYVPSPENENKSCCEEAELTANELARRNEELSEAEGEITLQKERAVKAEAERDKAWKEAEVWRKLWAKVANQFIAGTNEQQIERERDAWRKNAKTANDEAMAERDRAVRAEHERDELQRKLDDAERERDEARHQFVTDVSTFDENQGKFLREQVRAVSKGLAHAQEQRDELRAALTLTEADLARTNTINRELLAKLDAAEQRPTLDREAVEKVITDSWEVNGRGELEVFNEEKAVDAIMQLAPAVPPWLGDIPNPNNIEVTQNQWGYWAQGVRVAELSATPEELRLSNTVNDSISSAARREAVARFIEAEEAATGDDEQRVEEQARSPYEATHDIGLRFNWVDLDESMRKNYRAALRAGWAKESNKEETE